MNAIATGLERYDSYKDSGVEWLGEVPSHWEIIRNIGLFDERKETDRPDLELLSVTINRGVIRQEEITEKKDSSNEDKSKYKVVRVGDLAYNKMRMWQGAIGRSEYDGIVSPAYIILKPRNLLYSQFCHYLYRTDLFIGEANRHSYGLCLDMNSLRYENFKTIYSPVPPENEMKRIVEFLDEKTAEIDAAIAKKQRLIELLQEQKSILINRAVTRGLNPDAPLKDSGVDWIGKIPAHWDTVPLKYVSTIQSGVTLGKNYTQSSRLKPYPYLRVANVQNGFLDLSEITEINLPSNEAKNYYLEPGDILVTEGGDIDKLGRGSCWNGEIEECLHQNHIFAIRVRRSFNNMYVAILTGADYARRYFIETATKTTNLASTNKTKLGNLTLIYPPLSEQEKIVRKCEEIAGRINLILLNAAKAITSLHEMRSTLIASAVTGKIKV